MKTLYILVRNNVGGFDIIKMKSKLSPRGLYTMYGISGLSKYINENAEKLLNYHATPVVVHGIFNSLKWAESEKAHEIKRLGYSNNPRKTPYSAKYRRAELMRAIEQRGNRINWKAITKSQAVKAIKTSHGMDKSTWDKLNGISGAFRMNPLHIGGIPDASYMADSIENYIREIFPHSFVSVKFSFNLYPSISLRFAKGKDKSEWPNGIIHNDPLFMQGMIDGFENNGALHPKQKVEVRVNNNHKNMPFRAKTGSAEKIVEYVVNYFRKLKSAGY